ncbi:MAG TPA: serine hydrolase domain-containing protein [Vicinamibacterales bacterium]|jgi:methyl acetate hydrolase|nr:serine hydrolase domain-containing protein [Vicinamibacterales bacterium]
MARGLASQLLIMGLLLTSAIRAGLVAQTGRSATISTASLDEKLAATVKRGDVPGGLVVAAATKDRVLYQGAFGKAEDARERPMTLDAIFRIASMTKAVTCVAAMQLYEQGRFTLDDPAEKYLPELANLSVFESFDAGSGAYKVRPARNTVTIRHLFTHTSGLGYGFTSATVRDFKPREGEKYAAGPLVFEPGTEWLYGTSNDWVGRLVEKLSGQNLEEYFHNHIFVPLGMSDTFYNVPEDKQSRLVAVHQRKDGKSDGLVTEQPFRPPRPVTTFNGGGGLNSTAADYLRFVRMLLNGGTLDGARVLSPATVSLMAQNQIGKVGVPAIKSAQPDLSMDFTFVNDGKDKWGLGFLITTVGVAGKRSPGSLSWGGIDNTYFWVDQTRGVGGVVMMQFLPFADTKALGIYDTFERGVYQLSGY